ncbi:hypothetical protein [Alteribacter keqinensis]|uniref:hypothetical protein n=1 Tax=Alteribacter keqinensis TaxID=2483800 RepID=UPI00160588B4|nr:hypothetical protein [Alteribacter keqinensis]
MVEYLFVAAGTLLLIPIMMFLPSVFSRKVTALLVVGAGLLTAGAFSLISLYPWWVAVVVLFTVLLLISLIVSSRMKKTGYGSEDDDYPVGDKEEGEKSLKEPAKAAPVKESPIIKKDETVSVEEKKETTQKSAVVHKRPLGQGNREGKPVPDNEKQSEQSLHKRRQRLFESLDRDQ